MKNTLLVALLALVAYLPVRAQNPIIKDVFTADPAPLVYRDTLFLYTGHDTASVKETNYKMPDWRIYSTTDMVHWKDYGTRLSPKTFT
jgi:sucrose-6-phosphate hydrolase SacC (GH32 family)